MFVEHKIIIKNLNCVHCLFYLYFNTGYMILRLKKKRFEIGGIFNKFDYNGKLSDRWKKETFDTIFASKCYYISSLHLT